MNLFFFLFPLLLSCSDALYEDQAGKFDWYQQYIGKVESFYIEKQNVPSRRIILTSKNNVLAALNLHTGNIEWRQHLKEDDILSSVDYCKHHLSTVSTGTSGTLIRFWDTVLGTILWETHVLDNSILKSSIKCDIDSDTIYAALDDKLYSLRLKTGSMNWNKSLENVDILKVQKHEIFASKSLENVIILIYSEEGYSLKSFDFNGNKLNLPDFPFSTKLMKKDSCVISSTNQMLLCIDVSISRLFVLPLSNRSLKWTSTNIIIPTEVESGKNSFHSLQFLSADRLMILSSENAKDDNKLHVSIYSLVLSDNGESAECSLSMNVDNVKMLSSVEQDGKQYLVTLKYSKSKKTKNVEVQFLDVKDLREMKLLSGQFTLPKHHGCPINMEPVLFRKKDGGLAYRIFLITIDSALHFWHHNGNVLWTREESLADVATVEMIDLPVSDTEAKMDEEFGHNEGNIIHKFVKRISTQLSQLKSFVQEQLKQSRSATSRYYNDKDRVCHHKDECRSDEDAGLVVTDDDNGTDSSGSIGTTLRRDSFNVHKMLVLASTTGKLFGMESSTGRIVWRYLIDSVETLPGNKVQLFVLRTTAHFPHPPQAVLLMRCAKSGYPLLFTFNPITGLPQVPEPQILKYRIYQAALLPLPVSEENNYSKPVLILDKDLKVHIFPASYRLSLDTHPIYVYRVDDQAGFVVGYEVRRHRLGNCAAASEEHDCYGAHELWRLDFSTHQQKIAAVAFKSSMEQVHSVGRILSDRNVLYKYLNPNTLALMTESKNSSSPNAAVTVYLIDVVTGKIVYSTVHKKASGPVTLVQSENWIIYSFQNLRSHRTEMVVLELYEPYEIPDSIIYEFKDVDIEQLKRSMKSNRNDVGSGFDILSILGGERATTKMFSSEQRGRIEAGGDNTINGPVVLKQSYIFSTFIRHATVSITEKGITSKSIILALESGGIMDLPKNLLDPRRSMMMTQELMEEGIEPYIPEIPLRSQSIMNYNHSIARTRSIYAGPSGLESTSLVFVYGLDLFFTQIAPSKMFDVLKEDFDYIFIATVTIGMIVGAFVTQRLAARRCLYRAWQ